MARYISEDEFIAWVKEHYCSDCNNDNGLRCRVCWIDDAIDLVEEAPAADVAPKSEVAREIFAEIDNMLVDFVSLFHGNISKATIEQNKDKQQVNSVALSVINTTRKCLAELKKKYTEERE